MRLQVRDEDLQLQYECNLGNSTNVFLKDYEEPIHIWSGSMYGQKASVAFFGPDKPGYPEKDKLMKKTPENDACPWVAECQMPNGTDGKS
jgi:hypothetical protein